LYIFAKRLETVTPINYFDRVQNIKDFSFLVRRLRLPKEFVHSFLYTNRYQLQKKNVWEAELLSFFGRIQSYLDDKKIMAFVRSHQNWDLVVGHANDDVVLGAGNDSYDAFTQVESLVTVSFERSD